MLTNFGFVRVPPVLAARSALLLALFSAALLAGEPAPGVAEARKEVPLFKAGPEALAPTLALRLRFLKERCGPQERDRGKIDAAGKDLGNIEKDFELLAEGHSILEPAREMLMGYHSELDDSLQPYSLWIPPEYDGVREFPLVLSLHGQGMFNPLQCRAGPIGKMIVAAPQGRGGMDYMYVGEGDVLRVLEEVSALLIVDPNRVYVAGLSMGGAGSWHLGSHFPDRFAGIMPVCGNTDINVWQEQWYWRTPQDSPLAGVCHFLREDTCAVTYAQNMLDLGIVSLQGESDNIVNQLHARHMDAALKAAGHPNYNIYMLPFVMHGMSVDYAGGLQHFVRDPKPKHVTYKTAWLRYPGAYWLKITALQQRLKHATVDGLADTEKRTIEIKTSNVAELALERARLAFEGPPTQVRLDGSAVDSAKAQCGEGAQAVYCFHLEKEGWQPGPRPPAATFPPRKNAQVEGPAEHAFMSSFVVVPGNGGDITPGSPSPLREAIEKSGEEFAAQWKARFAVPCRKKCAVDLTEDDIAESNLILIGGPEQNIVTAHVLGKLPLALEQESVRLGGKTYSGQNLGAILCYPNPLNPKRYVVLMLGTTPRAYDGIHVRFGNWFDWVGYDYRRHYDFAVFDDCTNGHNPESFLVWGFFGENWQLLPETTFEAAPAWRGKSLPRVFPDVELPKLTEPRPETVWLDQMVARETSMYKEYLERNRTLEGSALQLNGKVYPRGLCCRFPCSLTFDCAGYQRFAVAAGVGW
ncbi:MAG: prolyl oligopeptidase family serine peptidase, partial [Planctomycetota bacterium]